jgi:hypothetical protein
MKKVITLVAVVLVVLISGRVFYKASSKAHKEFTSKAFSASLESRTDIIKDSIDLKYLKLTLAKDSTESDLEIRKIYLESDNRNISFKENNIKRNKESIIKNELKSKLSYSKFLITEYL